VSWLGVQLVDDERGAQFMRGDEVIHKWTLDLTDILSLLIHGLWPSLTDLLNYSFTLLNAIYGANYAPILMPVGHIIRGRCHGTDKPKARGTAPQLGKHMGRKVGSAGGGERVLGGSGRGAGGRGACGSDFLGFW
jgi:hypothetical protein